MVKGAHLQRWRDVNLPAPAPTNIGIAGTNTVLTYQRFTAPRPISGFERTFLLASDANSIYHGMAVQLTKRLSHRFQFTAAYTLGKVRDGRPESLGFNPGGPSDALLLSDSFDPRTDRGAGIEDARQRFVASGIWELDYANRLPTSAKAILGGWEFSGILIVPVRKSSPALRLGAWTLLPAVMAVDARALVRVLYIVDKNRRSSRSD